MTRQEQSIKISELPSSVSFNGLWTLGYQINGGKKTSVKVSLNDFQSAYESAVSAASEARKAAGTVTAATQAANSAAQSASGSAKAADEARTTLSTSVNNKLKEVDDKLKEVKDGKTPVLEVGTVEKGTNASASVTANGTDTAGNPRYKINLVLPKGEKGDDGTDGETPVFGIGTVTTGAPGTSASATVEQDGTTSEGYPLYRINLTVPRGQQGLPGTGSGNVSVSETGLVAGKQYFFVPDANNSPTGSFVEYTAPAIPEQVQPDWNATSGKGAILNKPAIPSKTSQLTNDSGFTTTTAVTALLSDYVQKVAGKGLSTEDFTTELKNKLASLTNYDDSTLQTAVSSLQNQLNTLLSGNASTAIESFNEIIAFLVNVEDTSTLQGIIAGINTTIASVQAAIPTNISQLANDDNTVKDANYVHTDNNYTTEEKEKLAGLGESGSLEDYVVTIASGSKQLFKAGTGQIEQTTAETFIGSIDDLLAAADAGKKIYIKNTETKTQTELKLLFRGDTFTSFLSKWALDSTHFIDLHTVINSRKSVINRGVRHGYLINTDSTIIAGGGVQEQYSLSGDITLTVKPDTFSPEFGCVTTVMLSTLKTNSANVTIDADSELDGKFVVIGDNPISIPENSVVELSVLFIKSYQTDMYVIRYSEPYTRPS